jgi:hypothetical protein
MKSSRYPAVFIQNSPMRRLGCAVEAGLLAAWMPSGGLPRITQLGDTAGRTPERWDVKFSYRGYSIINQYLFNKQSSGTWDSVTCKFGVGR